MRKFINSCLKELKLKSVIESETLGTDIKFYRVVAGTIDSKYILCEVFYSDADVFMLNPQQTNLIGDYKSLSLKDKVLASVRIYDDIQDCFSNSLDIKNVDRLNEFLSSYIDSLTDRVMDIQEDGLKILNVRVYKIPTFIIVINYSLDNIVQVPVKMFIGKQIVPMDYKDSSINFINKLNQIVGGDKFVR